MTVAVDSKGNRKEIHGPDVPEKSQKTTFQAAKIGALPKGVVRLEIWERVRQTTGVDLAAQKNRLDQEAGDKAEAKADTN